MKRFAFALALLVLWPGFAQAADQAATHVAPAVAPAPQAEVLKPEAEPASDIRAQLVPKRFATLSAEIPGRVDRVAFREGELFKRGQVLVSIDCSLQTAQLDESRAALTAAEKTKAVTKRLLELNSGGSLEADVSAAKADEAQARVNSAQAILSKCVIRAPYDGRVSEQKIREQQYVQPGMPLLDIIDGSSLEVEFIAPSAWISWLKPKMPFQITVDETGKSYPALIERVGARVDAVSHSMKVIGEIHGDFPTLLAGMSGRVVIAPPK